MPTPGVTSSGRSYARDIVDRIDRLGDFAERVGSLSLPGGESYPLLCVELLLGTSAPNLLVTAGLHGDEPAGAHAALAFAEEMAAQPNRSANVFVFPCLNPSGYERNTLANHQGLNLNRQFGVHSAAREVQLLEQWLADKRLRFAVCMDLHEVPQDYCGEGFGVADNPRGFYLYETQRNRSRRIGRQIVNAVRRRHPICGWTSIYGDLARAGVVSYPEGNQNPIYAQKTTLDAFLHTRYCPHTLTIETPTHWCLADRVDAQQTALREAWRHAVGAAR